jgi:hypothetical protein
VIGPRAGNRARTARFQPNRSRTAASCAEVIGCTPASPGCAVRKPRARILAYARAWGARHHWDQTPVTAETEVALKARGFGKSLSGLLRALIDPPDGGWPAPHPLIHCRLADSARRLSRSAPASGKLGACGEGGCRLKREIMLERQRGHRQGEAPASTRGARSASTRPRHCPKFGLPRAGGIVAISVGAGTWPNAIRANKHRQRHGLLDSCGGKEGAHLWREP